MTTEYTKSCKLLKYIRRKIDLDLFEIIEDENLESNFMPRGTGMSFLRPSKAQIEKIKSSKTRRVMIQALLIPLTLKTLNDFEEHKDSLRNLAKVKLKFESKSKSSVKVSGMDLELDEEYENFCGTDFNHEKLSVWNIKKGEPPIEGDQWIPHNRKESKPKAKKGGSQVYGGVNDSVVVRAGINAGDLANNINAYRTAGMVQILVNDKVQQALVKLFVDADPLYNHLLTNAGGNGSLEKALTDVGLTANTEYDFNAATLPAYLETITLDKYGDIFESIFSKSRRLQKSNGMVNTNMNDEIKAAYKELCIEYFNNYGISTNAQINGKTIDEISDAKVRYDICRFFIHLYIVSRGDFVSNDFAAGGLDKPGAGDVNLFKILHDANATYQEAVINSPTQLQIYQRFLLSPFFFYIADFHKKIITGDALVDDYDLKITETIDELNLFYNGGYRKLQNLYSLTPNHEFDPKVNVKQRSFAVDEAMDNLIE